MAQVANFPGSIHFHTLYTLQYSTLCKEVFFMNINFKSARAWSWIFGTDYILAPRWILCSLILMPKETIENQVFQLTNTV